MERLKIFELVHKSLSNGIRAANANSPRIWLSDRKLSLDSSGAVFNSAQIHHRKPEEYIELLVSIGFITPSGKKSPVGKQTYKCFSPNSILFPLKNEFGQIVNYYGVNIENGQSQYLNHEGIYPEYPKEDTRKIYLVNDPVEAATLMEARILDNKEAVMSFYENQSLLPGQLHALSRLTFLEEVICAI